MSRPQLPPLPYWEGQPSGRKGFPAYCLSKALQGARQASPVLCPQGKVDQWGQNTQALDMSLGCYAVWVPLSIHRLPHLPAGPLRTTAQEALCGGRCYHGSAGSQHHGGREGHTWNCPCVPPPAGMHSRCPGKHLRPTSVPLVAQALPLKPPCTRRPCEYPIERGTHLVWLSAAFSRCGSARSN